MGLYLVIEAENGLVLVWNRKTTVMIKLQTTFKVGEPIFTFVAILLVVVFFFYSLTGFMLFQGKLCGLCGNYDGGVRNDFTTRNKDVVSKAIDFANSWKVFKDCADATDEKNPCTQYPNNHAWAKKHCSIIESKVFSACHSKARTQQSIFTLNLSK